MSYQPRTAPTPGQPPGPRLCKHEHQSIPEAKDCGTERLKHTVNNLTTKTHFVIYDAPNDHILTPYQIHQAIRQQELDWERKHPIHIPFQVDQPYRSFKDIPAFLEGTYTATIPLTDLHSTLNNYDRDYTLDIAPDFQRIHVWTQDQQSAFIEHILRGGTNTVIRWNCPWWRTALLNKPQGPVTLVDGKQRLTAALDFLDDRIPAFGLRLSQWKDQIPPFTCNLTFIVNDLKTKAEVLQWYLEINRGNIAHTQEEIARVETLLQQETRE